MRYVLGTNTILEGPMDWKRIINAIFPLSSKYMH